MTRNEPGATGENKQQHVERDVQRDLRSGVRPDGGGPGNMVEAEEAAAQQTGAERAAAAEAGDPRAQAEQAQKEQAQRPDRIRHAAQWLDDKLIPRLGTADIGPYDEEPEDTIREHDACPLCGYPMGEHVIDRTNPNAVLICPVPPNPEIESYEPLNEVGMPKSAPAPGE